MSREINFRAWLKDDKRMVEVEEIHFRHQLIEYYDGNYDDCWLEKDFDKIELMQYTGLKDKNGKEIYEGDIVKFEGHGYISNVQCGEVIFKNGCFGIEYITDIARKYGWDKTFHQIGKTEKWVDMNASGTITYTYEAIGNVYQNRELLEENYE